MGGERCEFLSCERRDYKVKSMIDEIHRRAGLVSLVSTLGGFDRSATLNTIRWTKDTEHDSVDEGYWATCGKVR